jgi:hypothetical protein
MKIKTFLFALITIFILITGVRCHEEPIVSDLYHTWKFSGFGNVINSSLEKANPSDCEKCFMLTIAANGKVSGFSSTNTLSGIFYISSNKIDSVHVGGTKIYEQGNGEKYMEAINTIERYELKNNKLKLYFNHGQNYLLFDYFHH